MIRWVAMIISIAGACVAGYNMVQTRRRIKRWKREQGS